MTVRLFAALALTIFPLIGIVAVLALHAYAKWEDSRASE